MITHVNEQLWIDFNLDTAVFLDTLAYWIKKNAANQRNFHDGRYWSYNSFPAFLKLFPGWSTETIRRIIRYCVKHGLLMIGNYNKKNFDKTNWYTLTDKGLSYYPALERIVLEGSLNHPSVGSNARSVETNRPIPILQSTSSNNTITAAPLSSEPKLSRKEPSHPPILKEMIEAYRETFPDNPQPHPKVISTSLEKTLQTFIKRWPEHDPEGKAMTLDSFRRYMVGLKTFAPKFSLGAYVTPEGNRKKNSLETFCRWNTLVKFLENSYT